MDPWREQSSSAWDANGTPSRSSTSRPTARHESSDLQSQSQSQSQPQPQPQPHPQSLHGGLPPLGSGQRGPRMSMATTYDAFAPPRYWNSSLQQIPGPSVVAQNLNVNQPTSGQLSPANLTGQPLPQQPPATVTAIATAITMTASSTATAASTTTTSTPPQQPSAGTQTQRSSLPNPTRTALLRQDLPTATFNYSADFVAQFTQFTHSPRITPRVTDSTTSNHVAPVRSTAFAPSAGAYYLPSSNTRIIHIPGQIPSYLGIPMASLVPNPRSASAEAGNDGDPDLSPRRVATLRPAGQPITRTPGEDMNRQFQLLRGSVTAKHVAAKKVLQSLQSVELADLEENEKSCSICYNDFGAETPEGTIEKPVRLPKCMHVFGEGCLKTWLSDSDTCPYCRDKLPGETKYYHVDGRPVIDPRRTFHAPPHGLLPHGLGERSLEAREEGVVRQVAFHRHNASQPNAPRPTAGVRRPRTDSDEPRRRTRVRRNSHQRWGDGETLIDPLNVAGQATTTMGLHAVNRPSWAEWSGTQPTGAMDLERAAAALDSTSSRREHRVAVNEGASEPSSHNAALGSTWGEFPAASGPMRSVGFMSFRVEEASAGH
jgi:hypothetical protein